MISNILLLRVLAYNMPKSETESAKNDYLLRFTLSVICHALIDASKSDLLLHHSIVNTH